MKVEDVSWIYWHSGAPLNLVQFLKLNEMNPCAERKTHFLFPFTVSSSVH